MQEFGLRFKTESHILRNCGFFIEKETDHPWL